MSPWANNFALKKGNESSQDDPSPSPVLYWQNCSGNSRLLAPGYGQTPMSLPYSSPRETSSFWNLGLVGPPDNPSFGKELKAQMAIPGHCVTLCLIRNKVTVKQSDWSLVFRRPSHCYKKKKRSIVWYREGRHPDSDRPWVQWRCSSPLFPCLSLTDPLPSGPLFSSRPSWG